MSTQNQKSPTNPTDQTTGREPGKGNKTQNDPNESRRKGQMEEGDTEVAEETEETTQSKTGQPGKKTSDDPTRSDRRDDSGKENKDRGSK